MWITNDGYLYGARNDEELVHTLFVVSYPEGGNIEWLILEAIIGWDNRRRRNNQLWLLLLPKL